MSTTPSPRRHAADPSGQRRAPALDRAAAWLIVRHRVKPTLAGVVAELAGLGRARHG